MARNSQAEERRHCLNQTVLRRLEHELSRFLGLFAFAVLLQGCGSNPSVRLVSTGTSPQTSSEATTETGPPKCKGQVITGPHAEVTEHIPREGAALCVPSFRGFGGDLGFPGIHPAPQPVKLIVFVPQLGMSRGMLLANRSPIFNLEWLPSAVHIWKDCAAWWDKRSENDSRKNVHRLWCHWISGRQ